MYINSDFVFYIFNCFCCRTRLSLTVELVINLVVLTDTGNYVCQGEKNVVNATESERNAKKVTVRGNLD